MVTDKDDVRDLITELKEFRKIPELKKDADKLITELTTLLKKPFIEEKEFNQYQIKKQELTISAEKIHFEKAKKEEAPSLRLDTRETITIYSYKSREEGETDLFLQADRQKVEDTFLFIKFKNAKNEIKTIWIEIGDQEGPDFNRADPWKIGGILKKYSEEGTILEATHYHYHPDFEKDTKEMWSRVSFGDLMGAAFFEENVAPLLSLGVSMNFKVVNTDGIYSFSRVSSKIIENLTPQQIERLHTAKSNTARFLQEIHIPALFEPRPKKQIVH